MQIELNWRKVLIGLQTFLAILFLFLLFEGFGIRAGNGLTTEGVISWLMILVVLQVTINWFPSKK